MMDLAGLAFCSIPFLLPGAIGLYLLLTAQDEYGRMAGVFTLKPIVATPIWWMIVGSLTASSPFGPAHILSLLPGAGLTVIVVVIFRPVFAGPKAGSARALLALDCARWVNSFLLFLPGWDGSGSLACLFALIGLALPSIFAIVALSTTLINAEAQS